MFPPVGFADLTNRRVGVYGFGVEGRATLAQLTLVTADVVVVDDALSPPEALTTTAGGVEALLRCDVVLKSPGISPLNPTVQTLREAGVLVTSALNLWCTTERRDRVIAVTGTKGKSTTTSLITFALRALGHVAQSVGNIGRPPYDPASPDDGGWLVLELSSFQSVDLTVAPARIVVTALGSDHLDWHGSVEDYRRDKLSVTRLPQPHHTFVADSELLRTYRDVIGGDVSFVRPDTSSLATELQLLGDHSRSNVAMVLAAVAHATDVTTSQVAAAMRDHASAFTPLRGRLSVVLARRGVRFVDDGLATSALPTIAALDVFPDVAVSLLCGGFDRGVDYEPLADALQQRASPTNVVVMGPAGERIAAALHKVEGLHVQSADTMAEAVAVAASSLANGGVVLFSPAAPSFDRYANWAERSDDFVACAHALTTP